MNETAQPLDGPPRLSTPPGSRHSPTPPASRSSRCSPAAGRRVNVGEIVAAVDVVQSTVSAHLKVLAEVRFLLSEHQGTATYYRINDTCVDCFPTRRRHRHGPARAHPRPVLRSAPVPTTPPPQPGRCHRPLLRPGPHRPGRGHHHRLRPGHLHRRRLWGRRLCRNRRRPGRCAARQPRLRQPPGRRRTALRPDRPGPRLRRRPGRVAVRPPGRPWRQPPTAWTPAQTCSHSPVNAAAAGVTNATFLHGTSRTSRCRRHVDVVISNCVINLSTDKPRVLAEAFRGTAARRAAGRQRTSSPTKAPTPGQLAAARQRAGCLNGALSRCNTLTYSRPPGSPASASHQPTRPNQACTPQSSRRSDQLHSSHDLGCHSPADRPESSVAGPGRRR